ncbi:hypothetical protein ACQJBY_061041 [Aegilops geniculata]
MPQMKNIHHTIFLVLQIHVHINQDPFKVFVMACKTTVVVAIACIFMLALLMSSAQGDCKGHAIKVECNNNDSCIKWCHYFGIPRGHCHIHSGGGYCVCDVCD